LTISVNIVVSPLAVLSQNVTVSVTPIGTPRGIEVLISQAVISDDISGVTYGGVAMVEMPNSPFEPNTTLEGSMMHGYFLGSGIPSGTQDVVVTATASQGKSVTVIVLNGNNDLEVNVTEPLIDSVAENNPRANFAIGDVESFVVEVWTSGKSKITNIDPIAGWTLASEADFGAKVSGVYYYDTIDTVDVSCGYDNTGGGDDSQVFAFAINEIEGGGSNTILPFIAKYYNQSQ